MNQYKVNLIKKTIGIATLGVVMTFGGVQAATPMAIHISGLANIHASGPTEILQGDEKARAKAKKRYEKEQKKIAKRARKMEKQKAKIEKSDRKIEKIQRDLDRQARKVEDLERDLEQASNRSRTTD